MKTEHTPGEWHAHDGQIYPIETGKTLALIPYFNKDDKEHQANAQLIAAAPELLEALKEVAAFEKRGADKGEPRIGTGIMSIINAAIRKATKVKGNY